MKEKKENRKQKETKLDTTQSKVISESGTELGKIKVHENVVISIIRKVVSSIPEVTRLAGNSIVDNIAEFVGSKKIHDRAISVKIEENSVSADIKINVLFGANIPDTAATVQSSAIEEVEKMTGMNVSSINVIIQEIEELEDAQEEETSEEEEKN